MMPGSIRPMTTSQNHSSKPPSLMLTWSPKATGAATKSNDYEINAMSDKCEFCKGTGKEPGEDGCVWCFNTGRKDGQVLLPDLEPIVSSATIAEVKADFEARNQVQRHTIAHLRYAGGEEHNVKYVSEVDYDRVVADLAERDHQLGLLGQLLGEILVAAGHISPGFGLSGPQLLQFGAELRDSLSARAKPSCKYCGDTGQIMVGRSGDANDGNAPIMEPCEDCDRGAPIERDEPVAWFTDDHLTDKSATTWDRTVADRWRAKGWPVGELFDRSALGRKQ